MITTGNMILDMVLGIVGAVVIFLFASLYDAAESKSRMERVKRRTGRR